MAILGMASVLVFVCFASVVVISACRYWTHDDLP